MRKFLALEITGIPALANASSISPATDESRPENTKSTFLNSSGLQLATVISAIEEGRLTSSIQLAASLYFLPVERSDAPKPSISNQG